VTSPRPASASAARELVLPRSTRSTRSCRREHNAPPLTPGSGSRLSVEQAPQQVQGPRPRRPDAADRDPRRGRSPRRGGGPRRTVPCPRAAARVGSRLRSRHSVGTVSATTACSTSTAGSRSSLPATSSRASEPAPLDEVRRETSECAVSPDGAVPLKRRASVGLWTDRPSWGPASSTARSAEGRSGKR
jgi:hypothetical protein